MEQNRVKFSAIIVTYNSASVIERCCNALLKQNLSSDALEVILIDNKSLDTTLEVVRKNFPTVRILENTENAGFARACNQAVRQAQGELLLFLNPDVEVQKETLAELIKALESESASIAAPKLFDAEGNISPAVYRIPNLWLLMLKTFLPYAWYLPLITSQPDRICAVPSVTAACLLIRKNDYTALGGFDERFFLYFEDTDLCYRASQKGKRIVFVPSAAARHSIGHSSWQDMASFFQNYSRSELQFFRKHYSRPFAMIASILLRTGLFLRWISMGILGALRTDERWRTLSDAYRTAFRNFD